MSNKDTNQVLTAQEKSNNIIIDLKLKIDRVDYILTTLLDINNSKQFETKLSNEIPIINTQSFNMVQDNLIKIIGELAPIVEKYYKEEK